MVHEPWVGHDQIRDALRELADETMQRDLWLSERSPADFTECIEMLFTDSALGLALDKGASVFDARTDGLLRKIRDLVKRIDGQRAPDAVINDPLMPEVRRLASDALAAMGRADTAL